jgi:hypothetical protein
MQQKSGSTLDGGTTFVKLNLAIGAGVLALLVGIGSAEEPVVSVPILAAVCGVLTAGFVLVGVIQE